MAEDQRDEYLLELTALERLLNDKDFLVALVKVRYGDVRSRHGQYAVMRELRQEIRWMIEAVDPLYEIDEQIRKADWEEWIAQGGGSSTPPRLP